MIEERPGKRRVGAWPGNRDRVFFLGLALLISVTGFAGFSFTYFGPIIGGSYPAAGVALHLHGWSFFFWYLLFPFQAALIARRKRGIHKILGRCSVVLVLIMTLTGVLVLTVRVEEATRTGEPQIWLRYGPLILSNLILFVAFYSAAIWTAAKNRLQSHKRMLIVASAIGLGAGFFRLILFVSGFHPLSLPAGVLGCSLFIIIGIAYDLLAQRHVHPAYWIGLVVMFAVEVPLLPQINPDGVAWVNGRLATIGEQLGIFYQPEPTVEF